MRAEELAARRSFIETIYKHHLSMWEERDQGSLGLHIHPLRPYAEWIVIGEEYEVASEIDFDYGYYVD
jgi:hypothetical protein